MVDIKAKLLSKIEIAPGPLPTDCWLWIGARNNYDYGYITLNGWPEGTHRLSWQLHCGPIPDGMWVLHKCDRPPCCRPDHLFLGTQLDNVADMLAKGRNQWR